MSTTSVTLAWGVLAAAGQEAAEIQNDGLARNCTTLTAYQEAHGKKGKDWQGAQYFPCEIITEQHTAITQFTDGFDPFAGGAAEVSRVLMYPFAVSGLLMKIGVQEMYALANSKGALRKRVMTLVAACAGVLKRAFEPYVTTKAKGTGLGLAVVKKIADEHGARLDIANRVEEGVVKGAQVSLSFSVEKLAQT